MSEMNKKTECKEPEKKQNTIDDEALDNVGGGAIIGDSVPSNGNNK